MRLVQPCRMIGCAHFKMVICDCSLALSLSLCPCYSGPHTFCMRSEYVWDTFGTMGAPDNTLADYPMLKNKTQFAN